MTLSADNSLPSPSTPQTGSTRWFLLAIVGVAIVLMSAGSLMPWRYKQLLHTHGRFHSLMHVAAFGGLALLSVRSTRSPRVQMCLIAGCLIFGVAMEVVEGQVFRAPVEWVDVVADAIGIAFASVLAWLLPA